MPRVKRDKVHISNAMGVFVVDVVFNVNAAGEFYCNIPEELIPAYEGAGRFINGVQIRDTRGGVKAIYADKLDTLYSELKAAMTALNEPEVTKEPVIQYNIESHVSFAVTEAGDIRPNAAYPGARWERSDSQYGEHHAMSPAQNGYSLTVGARAMMRVTTTLRGRAPKVSYERYYGEGGSHLGNTNPAEKLNSWCSFTLPNNPKEIPYTDEAAEFFFRLMHGMATLSKMIQERTFDQEQLLKLIEMGPAVPLLGGPAPKKEVEA